MSTILHVDMDAFYASVEERERPELRGRPVVVGGSPSGRGVVAAANYEARRFGVHSAMPSAQAARLCPQAVFVRSRMDLYADESRRIHEVFARYTPIVEPLALDEAFLDVRASERLFGGAHAIARRIRADVRAELGLVASVGVAPNKFLAKLASALEKPDGLTVVPEGGVQEFLDPLPVAKLWGVGDAALAQLAALGVDTVADLRRVPPGALRARFGRRADHLGELARGVDRRAVVPDARARSLGHETTFARDVGDARILRARLLELTEQVARRARARGVGGRRVTVKARYGDFRTVTRATTLAAASRDTAVLWRTASRLLADQLAREPGALRLIGVTLSALDAGGGQCGLFDAPEAERAAALDRVSDAIAERFGDAAVRRGGALRR